MKIAITGANGYIGRHLVPALERRGHSVATLVRSSETESKHESVKTIKGDLSNIDALSDLVLECSVVCNLAGEYICKDKMIETNVHGMQNLFNIAKKSSIKRFVHLSSVGVYGRPRSGVYEEDSEMKAINKYEESKIIADEWLMSADSLGMEKIILRPSNIFGPDMKNDSLRELVASIEKRNFLFVGKKSSMANYIYIENLVNSIMAVIEDYRTRPILQIYNLNNHTTMEVLVQSVTNALDISYPRIRLPYWFVFILAAFFDAFSSIFGTALPLTRNRLAALTSRVIFSSRRFGAEYSLEGEISVEEGIKICTNRWVRRKSG